MEGVQTGREIRAFIEGVQTGREIGAFIEGVQTGREIGAFVEGDQEEMHNLNWDYSYKVQSTSPAVGS